MRSILTLSLVPALALSLAAAPARADDARKLELAKQLVAQIHLVDAVKSVLPLMAAQMRAMLSAQGTIGGDTDEFVRLYQERLGVGLGRYGDLMAEAYAQIFTEDDLSGLIAFDDTPLGRKLIANQPGLVQASAVATQSVARDVAQEVVAEMQRRKAQDAAPGKL